MTSQSRSDSSSPSSLPGGLFLQPASPPPSMSSSPSSTTDPSEPSSPQNSPTTALPTDDWSAGSHADATESASDHDEPSSRPSTGELPSGSLASKGELAGTVRAGLIAAGTAAHEFLADDDAKQLDAYLFEEQEVDDIGAAAAGLLSRRVPAGVGSPDMTDLVKLGLVLAGYIGRQFRIRRYVKAARAGALSTVTGTEGQEQEAGAWSAS